MFDTVLLPSGAEVKIRRERDGYARLEFYTPRTEISRGRIVGTATLSPENQLELIQALAANLRGASDV